MNQKMCNNCKKVSEEYYELKLQIRFIYFEDINILDKKKEEIEKLVEKRFNTINKMEEVENGFDFYFREHGEMNKINNLLNKRYFYEEIRTKKIVGHDFLTSKDIWRYTQLIRIINLNVRDEISVKGKDYYIKAFNHNDLVLRSLDNGSKKVVTYSIVKDYLKLIRKKEDIDKEAK